MLQNTPSHLRFSVSRLDRGHLHPLSDELPPHGKAEVVDKGLSSAVHIAHGKGVVSGDTTNVDNVALLPLEHAGEDRSGSVKETLAVDVDHALPVIDGCLGHGGSTQGKPGVVDEYGDVGKLAGKAFNGGKHFILVRDVHAKAVGLGTIVHSVDLLCIRDDDDDDDDDGVRGLATDSKRVTARY